MLLRPLLSLCLAAATLLLAACNTAPALPAVEYAPEAATQNSKP